MISCGFNFAMLLSKHGVVYGVGNNEQGELGLHIKNDEANSNGRNYYYTPEENKLHQQEKIAQKNREAFAAAEARRIRQSAASGTRYWQETYDPTKTYTKPQSQTKLH